MQRHCPSDNTENSGNTENSAEDFANMGKEQGIHTGPNQGATLENDTQKSRTARAPRPNDRRRKQKVVRRPDC